MKSKDQQLLEEAYNIINESFDMSYLLVPLAGVLAGSAWGAIYGFMLSMQAADRPANMTTIKQIVKGWFSDRALRKIASRIENDPDVQDFIEHPQKKGWQKMIAAKLTEDEMQYLRKLNRSHFDSSMQ